MNVCPECGEPTGPHTVELLSDERGVVRGVSAGCQCPLDDQETVGDAAVAIVEDD